MNKLNLLLVIVFACIACSSAFADDWAPSAVVSGGLSCQSVVASKASKAEMESSDIVAGPSCDSICAQRNMSCTSVFTKETPGIMIMACESTSISNVATPVICRCCGIKH